MPSWSTFIPKKFSKAECKSTYGLFETAAVSADDGAQQVAYLGGTSQQIGGLAVSLGAVADHVVFNETLVVTGDALLVLDVLARGFGNEATFYLRVTVGGVQKLYSNTWTGQGTGKRQTYHLEQAVSAGNLAVLVEIVITQAESHSFYSCDVFATVVKATTS